MRCFVRAPGVLLLPLGEGWAAFSTLSGETHLINDEGAAILEALDAAVPQDSPGISRQLSEDCGVSAQDLDDTLCGSWGPLIEAGLVREHWGETPLTP